MDATSEQQPDFHQRASGALQRCDLCPHEGARGLSQALNFFMTSHSRSAQASSELHHRTTSPLSTQASFFRCFLYDWMSPSHLDTVFLSSRQEWCRVGLESV